MNTIIEKIRAEIERQEKQCPLDTYDGRHKLFILGGLKTFLSDLEKSEKPMNLETLEEDVKSWFFNEISSKINVEHTMYYYFQECARRYYELGCRRTAEKYDEIEYNRQRAEDSVPKDLGEVAVEYSQKVSDGHNYRDLRVGFIAGAIWQKEQMITEAVPFYEILKAVPPGPERENVRIIIVKED